MLFWRPRDLSVVNVVRPWKLVSRSAIATPLVQMQPWLLDFESHGSPVFHTKNSKESCFLKGVMFIVWKLRGWLQKSFLQQTKETNWEMEAQKELQEKRCWRQPVGADLCGEACVVWGLQFVSLLRNQTDMVPMGAQVGSKVVHKWEAAQLAHVDSSMGVEDDNITVPFGGAKIAKAQRES